MLNQHGEIRRRRIPDASGRTGLRDPAVRSHLATAHAGGAGESCNIRHRRLLPSNFAMTSRVPNVMMEKRRILHVADTALWMASIRAGESSRPDAIFRDALAAQLSGDEGAQIERSVPNAALSAWGVVVRTSAIDRLVAAALQERVDTVLNLGAGYDTRPYRLSLPADLRWIEVDFPALIADKNSKLRDRQPVCTVERIGLDLSDRSKRSELFAALGVESARTLLITEGLIPYFSTGQVVLLSQDAHAVPSFRYWIQDFDNAGERRTMPGRWDEVFKAAPLLFQVKDWFKFFLATGWSPKELITSAEESELVDRPFPLTFPLGVLMRVLPISMRRRILGTTGAVLMEKQEYAPNRACPHPR
jgi:methyltransferase (TIGR00027 family)